MKTDIPKRKRRKQSTKKKALEDFPVKKIAAKRKEIEETALLLEEPIVQQRTLEAFIEDLVSDGKTPKQIRSVAFNCPRWRSQKDEAYHAARNFLKKLKKK